jgi:hypothetical protein
MKKSLIFLLFLCVVINGQAQTRKATKKSLIEFGPKANLYIGSVRFGIGAEILVNPLKTVGLRTNLTELIFGEDNTRFHFNLRDISIDGILYLPMPGLEPYVFLGFGLAANGHTDIDFRGGLGLNYPITRGSHIFVEPGAIISHNSYTEKTDISFRLSAGGRFTLIR